MRYGFIYETTNLINGKKYIGSHRRTQDIHDPDDSWYLGSGKLLWQAIHKYGIENFSRRILLECDSKEELEYEETRILEKYDAANDPMYYNLMPSYFGGTSGGRNSPRYGKHHSEETKQKIGAKSGASRLRMTLSEEHKANISKSLNTEENRKRQSNLIAGRVKVNNGEIERSIFPDELDSYLAQGYVRGRLPSTVEKISQSNTGNPRPHTENQEKALLESVLGTIAVSKDGVTRRISKDLVDSYLNDGWSLGMSEEFREKRSSDVKGKVHIYKGEDQKFITQSELDSYLADGWARGLPPSQRAKIALAAKRREQSKYKWINKDGERKRVPASELEEYLARGYSLGME